jgi:hypothetical protein
MIVDSTQYLIDRSVRVLRGMSLLGRLQNYFSEEPTIQQQQQPRSAVSTSRTATVDRPDLTGFICPECLCLLDTANDLLQHYSSHNDKQSATASNSTATQQQQQQQQPSSSISNESPALQEQRQRMKAQQVSQIYSMGHIHTHCAIRIISVIGCHVIFTIVRLGKNN